MNRRSFAGFGLAAVGGIFVPQFGRWFQWVNEPEDVRYFRSRKVWGVTLAPTGLTLVTVSWRNHDGSYTGRQYPCVTHGNIVTVDWGGVGPYQPFTVDRV